MDTDRFPSVTEVRAAPPGELAAWLSTMTTDAVRSLPVDAAEAVVVATQRVSSWMFGVQSVAVDRFAEHVMDAQEAHAADLVAARDAQREAVEAAGGVWRGDAGALALPDPDMIAASMLAPELRISPRTMRTRLNRARALMELPTTLRVALAGEVEPWRVDAVVAAASDVDAEHLVEFESRLYAVDVTTLPKPRLAERARGAAAKADPESVERGVARAPRRRRLRVGPSQDAAGVMRWTVDVPDDLSRRMFAAVDALAHEYLSADREVASARPSVAAGAGAGAGVGGAVSGRRTVEQARLDALGDLVLGRARVETVVELLVPAAAGSAPVSFVERRDARAAAHATFGGRPAGGAARGGSAVGDSGDGGPGDGGSGAGGDAVVVDLVLGSVTRDTLAAGHLERTHGRTLGGWLETEDNPFLAHHRPTPPPVSTGPPGPDPCTGAVDPPGQPPPVSDLTGAPPQVSDLTGAPVWFVPGVVQAPGATALLPEHVTALLADPDTRLRVTDATPGAADGNPAQRRTYRPRAALAATVRARDRHCRFPGCSVPATRCHLDHVTPFPLGETVEANLQALCPAHHGFKHHAGWTVTMSPDGTCDWTTPGGRTHTTAPPDPWDTAA